jgi:hypothetical protein
LVILQEDAQYFYASKSIMHSFADSTRLEVNYNKSHMMPMNMMPQRLNHFANSIQCKTRSLPFAYLGLPLGITKPSLEFLLPMVQRVERSLCGIVDFLDYGQK